MFPEGFVENTVSENTAVETGVDFLFDYNTGQHVMKTGEVAEQSVFTGIKQFVENVLRTPAGAYKVYTKEENEVFGISVYNYIGKKTLPMGYLNSELKREVTENLLRHPMITDVTDWNGTRERRGLSVSFSVILSDSSIINFSKIISESGAVFDV